MLTAMFWLANNVKLGKLMEKTLLGGMGVGGFLYTFHTPFLAFLIFIIIRFQSALYIDNS